MASDFGLKIGVEGEREFKKSLQDINGAFKVLGSEMALVTSQFDKNDKSIENYAKQNEVLAKQIDTQKSKIDTLNSALENAQKTYGENSSQAQKWQIQLNKAQAELNNMERAVRDNNKAIEDAKGVMADAGNSAKNLDARFADAVQGIKKFGDVKGQITDVGTAIKDAGAKIKEMANPKNLVDFAKNAGDALKGKLTDGLKSAVVGVNDFVSGTKDVKPAADEMTKAVENSGKSADDAGNKFDALGGILKGIGGVMAGAFTAIGGAVIAGTKALSDFSVETAAYADTFITMSTVTGVSAEALQAYSYAADLVDVSLETMTGSMAKNIKSMTAYTNGNKQAIAAYDSLGVSVTDANGNLRDSETVYWELIDALGKIEDETARDSTAMTLFGRSAQELNPLIAQGSAGIAELTKEAHDMGAVLSDDALMNAGAFDDTIQRLKQGSDAAKRNLGTVLMPTLNNLGTTGVELLAKFNKALSESGGDLSAVANILGEVVGDVADVILKELPTIINMVMSLVGAIGNALLENLPMIANTASQLIMTLLDAMVVALPLITQGAVQLLLTLTQGILDNLPALVEAAVHMVSALVSGIGDALPTLIPAMVDAVMLMAQTLFDNLPMLMDAALKLIVGLAEGLIAAIPKLIERLPELISSILNFLLGNIPKFVQAGIDLLMAIVKDLPTIIKAIVKAVPQIITAIINAIIDNYPLIVEAGFELFKALIQALPEIWGLLYDGMMQLLTGIYLALESGIPRLVDFGKQMIEGIWNGISSVANWLREKISGFFGGVVDNIKDFFGIHSPSTLFAGLGKNMADGLGVGFSNEMDSVSEEMIDSIPQSVPIDIKPEVEVPEVDTAGSTESLSGMIFGTPDELIAQGEDSAALIRDGILQFMPTFMTDIKNMANELGKASAEIGTAIVDGVWKGILSKQAMFYNQVYLFFANLIKQVRSQLGIRSPSSVFADIGENMALGLGEGFETQMKKVSREMNAAIPTTFGNTTNLATDMINGLMGINPAMGGQPITLQVTLDSKVIAQTIFDPLKSVSRQRGVALG
jgi:predicted  nucleic acid-binding Zn-ribbon protein